MGRLVVRGKYIWDGADKFFARGVSYGPFAPNSRGERYPEPERAAADFALMRELGANLVRTYVPPPPWMFDLAAKNGLRLMVGMPWPFHMAFLDSPQMMRDIRNTIRDGVRTMRRFADVIFAYSLGNEVRSDIVRWHGPRVVSRFLNDLFELGKQEDPEGLFTYSNYPSAEYLELNFLDFVSFNVYLHRDADFRRYLTHLLAATYDRPLLLSETGMDTIREGEAHQAELLAWQSRAAFELGLSGFIVFAFTDEWHTGGAEITDWNFGLVTRDRKPKPAFNAMAQVFRAPMPPALKDLPHASVVVAAYNAAPTLAACLESLQRLNYPSYEIILADDGSTDDTARIAAEAGVRVLALAHRGLGAARNAGIAAATGQIVAFIDSDAEADRDWLYHLVETLTRAGAPAAGGQNFPPFNHSAVVSAIAAAPGEPREVRLGADQLEQLCGCSMALDKSKLATDEAFDPAFQTAGDDVDFSWSLRDRGSRLAYAPAAVVLHDRRSTVLAYLRQQAGYGRGEGLLFRKYPERSAVRDGLYAGPASLGAWFRTGPRVYYGAFGRGLFQTVYPGSLLPMAAQMPLTFQWIALTLILVALSFFDRLYAVVGLAGLAITLICGGAGAARAPGDRAHGIGRRLLLAALWILGPLVRSFERWRVMSSYAPLTADAPAWAAPALRGGIALVPSNDSAGIPPPEKMVAAMRAALLRRGLTVARGDGYVPYDLQIILPLGLVRVPILLLEQGWQTSLGWHSSFMGWRFAAASLVILAIFGFGTIPFRFVIAAVAILFPAAITFLRTRQVAIVIAAAAAEVAAQFGLNLEPSQPDAR
ncbi:MAG TPA: glycosyltransferase [Candidatus Binataceae bacterium]|nr:glycosyltransferase [Candidatus Binataceae bacterium]